jgi:hypothetical protein
MALVIEDGTNVENATSYITVAEAQAFASARGVTLSVTSATVEVQIIKAMDWFEAKRAQFVGTKANTDQALQWPRSYVYIDNILQADDDIPNEVKNTLCQLVIEIHNGIDLSPTTTGNFVKREKVDVIEVEYSESLNTTGMPTLSKVNSLIAPLLKNGFGISTVRI